MDEIVKKVYIQTTLCVALTIGFIVYTTEPAYDNIIHVFWGVMLYLFLVVATADLTTEK